MLLTKKLKNKRLAMGAFTAAILPSTSDGATELVCPPSIELTQNFQKQQDWVSFDGVEQKKLLRIGFFSGHPNDGASLAPEATKAETSTVSDKFYFLDKKSDPVWIACYFHGTDAFIAKLIDSEISHCTVSYRKIGLDQQGHVSDINCSR